MLFSRNRAVPQISTEGGGCNHVEVHVGDISAARRFYVDALGLQDLQEMPSLNLLAVRAGDVRISIFGGRPKAPNSTEDARVHLILRTDSLAELVAELKVRGVEFEGEVYEAPGFCRDIKARDPDGNLIESAEYLRGPLAPLV